MEELDQCKGIIIPFHLKDWPIDSGRCSRNIIKIQSKKKLALPHFNANNYHSLKEEMILKWLCKINSIKIQ
jgi:hypothetical protein